MGYSRSRARCVPLQYPSSATRGVKQALNINKQALNQNLIVSTPLQEKKNFSDGTLNLLSEESTDQVAPSESGMFYELSSRKRMECEKYQDCSWFQQSPIKPDCNSDLLLAETIDSFTEADEINLPLQMSPWGDEYPEVFTDDILLEEKHKLGEKKNFISNENFYASYKADENNTFDSFNVDFSLKKTDSVDSMKNISSTNPAEVIPISYKEQLNYSNYGLTKVFEVKNEIKKEVEMYSPESSSYVMDSDDNDLNIGREEVVEEMNSAEDLQLAHEKEPMNLDHVKPEVSLSKTASECTTNEKVNYFNDSKFDNNSLKNENGTINQTTGGKIDLNLDIAKLNFEQSLNMNTPDLDFMDLVNFINEEMRQESSHILVSNSIQNNNNNNNNNNNTNTNTNEVANSNQHVVSREDQNDTENVDASVETLHHSSSSPVDQSPVNDLISTDLVRNSTVDLKDLSNTGVSIAERIKTSAKRKTRKSVRELIDTEDEESCSLDEDDEDDDVDFDYDYREDIVKRRCASVNRRIKSSYSESTGDCKRIKEESSSYRERRDKNNEASRRSRQNRKARERHMYETLEEEEKRNVKLKAEADVLEKQVTSLRQLLLQVVLRKGGAT